MDHGHGLESNMMKNREKNILRYHIIKGLLTDAKYTRIITKIKLRLDLFAQNVNSMISMKCQMKHTARLKIMNQFDCIESIGQIGVQD